jgi:hypothetical protein
LDRCESEAERLAVLIALGDDRIVRQTWVRGRKIFDAQPARED